MVYNYEVKYIFYDSTGHYHPKTRVIPLNYNIDKNKTQVVKSIVGKIEKK